MLLRLNINQATFGSPMPNRSFSASSYKYGFNGQEKDDEVAGAGNINTAMFWEYDTRLGRRWNLDPKPTIGISDYSCFGNNPIVNIDLLGDKWKNKHDAEVADNTKKRDNATADRDAKKANLEAVKSTGGSDKDIAKAQKSFNKSERVLEDSQKDLDESIVKQQFVNQVLENLRNTNSDWYNYWDNYKPGGQKVDILVSATTDLIPSPYGDTKEATGMVVKAGGGFEITQTLYMQATYNSKTNEAKMEIVKSRCSDSAHGLGHKWLKSGGYKSDNGGQGENNAIEYSDRVMKGKKLQEIHSDTYSR